MRNIRAAVLLGLVLVALPRIAAAQVAIGTGTPTRSLTPATGTGATSSAWTVSGSGIAIVVKIGTQSAPTSVNVTTTFTSGTPTQCGTFDTSAAGALYLWVIPNVTAGTGTYTVTLGSSVAYQVTADYFTGTDTTTPCQDAVSSETNSGSTITVTPANLTANDAAAGFGINATAGDAPTWNQTQTYNNNTTNVNMAGGYHLSTGSVSVTWGSFSSGDSGVLAARVVAGAGGGGGSAPKRLPLLGVGVRP